MYFYRTAGVFKAGILGGILGPLVPALGGAFAAPNLAALYPDEPNRGALVLALLVAALGGLISFSGYIMVLVAIYRAMV